MSLINLGVVLSELGLPEEALKAGREAVEIAAPFVEKLPQAFSQLSTKLLKAYAPARQAAGVEADASLLDCLERPASVS